MPNQLILSAAKLNNSRTSAVSPGAPVPKRSAGAFLCVKSRGRSRPCARSLVAPWVVCRWGTTLGYNKGDSWSATFQQRLTEVSETTTKLASFYRRAFDCTPSGEKQSSSSTVEVQYGHDYSRLAGYYPRPADDRWRDLGPRRFVESKKADGNSTETLGYGDCNDLRRVWHARYCPGLTPVAHSGFSGCGGSLELRRYRPL